MLSPHRIEKLFLKNSDVFPSFTEHSKQGSGAHDLGFVQLDEATFFSCYEKDVRLLVIGTDSCIINGNLSASF